MASNSSFLPPWPPPIFPGENVHLGAAKLRTYPRDCFIFLTQTL